MIKSGDFVVASASGWPVREVKRCLLKSDARLVALVNECGPHVIVRGPALQALAWQDANHLAHDFDLIRAGWVIPLFAEKELVGLIAMGAHTPERTFDETDFKFFRQFAFLIARCVRNAREMEALKNKIRTLEDSQSKIFQNTKLDAIEKLASGIAHEIHNPLAIISGKAQVLLLQRSRGPVNPEVEEALKTIVKQTKRAADITRKLLMYSQGAAGRTEPVEIEKTLDETLALVAYQSSLEKIRISKSIAPGLPKLTANVQEIREVFFNLLLNAVESIGSDGEIHIQAQYRPKDEVLEIQFGDTGKGILPDDLDKLFDPFFTTRHEAVGLGLFVTKQIIHRYGGSIRVESYPHKGSLFIIQWPCPQPGEVPVSGRENYEPSVSCR